MKYDTWIYRSFPHIEQAIDSHFHDLDLPGRADIIPDLYDVLAHVAAWGPCCLHDLGQVGLLGRICSIQILRNVSLRQARVLMV